MANKTKRIKSRRKLVKSKKLERKQTLSMLLRNVLRDGSQGGNTTGG